MTAEKPLKDPLPIHYLKERIESWGVLGDSVVIKPKDASFNELHVRKIFIDWGFGEFKWQFTGFLHVVPREEMDGRSVRFYRILKNLETDLKWRGVFPKKPIFEVSPNLRDLTLHIKELRPNEELAKILNSDNRILRIVRRVKPDLLRIRLESAHLEGFELSYADKMEPLDLIKRYYEDPYRVIWLVAITRMNFPNPWIGNLMKDMYDLLKGLCELVRRKTSEVEASIRGF